MGPLRNHKYSAEIPIELWLGSGVLIIFNLRSKHDRFHSRSFKNFGNFYFRCWPIKFPCFGEQCTFLKILSKIHQNHVFRIKITTISLGAYKISAGTMVLLGFRINIWLDGIMVPPNHKKCFRKCAYGACAGDATLNEILLRSWSKK